MHSSPDGRRLARCQDAPKTIPRRSRDDPKTIPRRDLTRRSNHWHYSIIPQYVRTQTNPAPEPRRPQTALARLCRALAGRLAPRISCAHDSGASKHQGFWGNAARLRHGSATGKVRMACMCDLRVGQSVALALDYIKSGKLRCRQLHRTQTASQQLLVGAICSGISYLICAVISSPDDRRCRDGFHEWTLRRYSPGVTLRLR